MTAHQTNPRFTEDQFTHSDKVNSLRVGSLLIASRCIAKTLDDGNVGECNMGFLLDEVGNAPISKPTIT